MQTTEEYFAHYKAIAILSSQMLVAAREGEWSDLKAMQSTYRELVEQLRKSDHRSELDDTARARKLNLVKKILDAAAAAAAIRDLTLPSLARLGALFTVNSPARTLKKMIGLR